MPPDTTTSTVAAGTMSFSRTYIDHGTPLPVVVLLAVIALAALLVAGLVLVRRRLAGPL